MLLFVLAQIDIANLADKRKDITFLPYTPSERVQVAESVKNLFDLYVHRQQKIDYYGAEFTNIDPVPRAAQLQSNAEALTDEEFHLRYSYLFRSLRDFHTQYYFPAPHSCWTAQQPLIFEFATKGKIDPLNPVVVVASFSPQSTITVKGVDIGDELVSFNGLSFPDFAKRNAFVFGGANEFGAQRAALKALTMRYGKILPMPEEDTAVFVLKKQSGQTIRLSVPWQVFALQDCLTNSASVSSASRPSLDHFSKFFSYKQSLQFITTEEPIITYAIYNPQRENLGIIKLESFVPGNGSVEHAFNILRDLVQTVLSDTNAIVIDLRSNGGGSILLADLIPTIFKSDTKVLSYNAINTELSRSLLLSVFGAKWTEPVKNTKSGDKFVANGLVDTNLEVNHLGAVYFKPFGILNNAECYSACDLFSANIQDNDVGLVFGEDGKTGAGGANVLATDFLSTYLPKDFPPFPFNTQLKEDAQGLRVSYRQMVRRSNKLIEDYGVEPEFIVRPTVNDIIAGSRDSVWQFIAKALDKYGRDRKINNVVFDAKPLSSYYYKGTDVVISVTSSGIQNLKALVQGKTAVDFDFKSLDSTKYTLTIKTDDLESGYVRIDFVGTNGKTFVVQTYLWIYLLPEPSKWIEATSVPLLLNFDTPSFTLVNEFTLPENGWQRQGSQMQILNYGPSVNSAATFTIANAQNPTVTLKIEYDFDPSSHAVLVARTEAGFQQLATFVKQGSSSESYQIAASGPVDVALLFQSSSESRGNGVVVTELSIKK